MASLRFLCPSLRGKSFSAQGFRSHLSGRGQASIRAYSTSVNDVIPLPLLQTLKGDLKTAMRAKDAPRLSVLRSIMAANLNASKTSSPIRTDAQLVALIRKLEKGTQDAIDEARSAEREDLVQKETEQLNILQQYVSSSGVQTIGETEIRAAIQDAVHAAKEAGTSGKSLVGDVMKRLNHVFEGKDVDKKSISSMVKEMVAM